MIKLLPRTQTVNQHINITDRKVIRVIHSRPYKNNSSNNASACSMFLSSQVLT